MKRVLKKVTAALLAATMVVGLAACGNGGSSDDKSSKSSKSGKVKIGVSIWSSTDVLGSQCKKMLDAAAKALDVEVQYVDQGHVSEKVTASVEQLAAAGCQGIIICNSSDTEMTSAIKTCNDNKVYLAQFFRVISKKDSADIYKAAKDSAYYIGAVHEDEPENGAEPISSFGEHGAIVHYTSSPETDVELKEGQLFLTDTGAGFYEGSTDVTRTYALGEVPQIMKDHFTLVAISNLQLGSAKFLEGSTGMILDILARNPFWDRDLNFNHGTGHGVGYLLNIHEGPAGFRWKYRKGETEVLQEGMVITDEPGIYIEGSHGIRLENELLTCKGTLNEYGQFMYFEAITLIPMDLDAINPDIMTQEDKKLLNDYHAKVYEVIAPYLNEEEQEWLKKYTRAI